MWTNNQIWYLTQVTLVIQSLGLPVNHVNLVNLVTMVRFILVIVTSSLNQFYGPSVSPFRDLLIQVDPPPAPQICSPKLSKYWNPIQVLRVFDHGGEGGEGQSENLKFFFFKSVTYRPTLCKFRGVPVKKSPCINHVVKQMGFPDGSMWCQSYLLLARFYHTRFSVRETLNEKRW